MRGKKLAQCWNPQTSPGQGSQMILYIYCVSHLSTCRVYIYPWYVSVSTATACTSKLNLTSRPLKTANATPLSSVPNCPCNNAWYCYCPFTSAYLCAHCAVFESASLGPGAQLCERQRLCLIVLGTASVATWVIQSACSSSPSSTHQIELFPHLHTDKEECGLGPNRSEWIRASYACRKRGLDKHHDFEIRCS